MENGTAILIDLDRKIYKNKPAPKQKMAVRVPDWNIPQMTKMPVAAKKIRSHVILLVMAMMINTTEEDAALIP